MAESSDSDFLNTDFFQVILKAPKEDKHINEGDPGELTTRIFIVSEIRYHPLVKKNHFAEGIF